MTQPSNDASAGQSSLRIAIQQPALPAYRVPVFARLNARDGLSIELFSGEEADLENAQPDDFPVHWTEVKFFGELSETQLFHNKSQWKLAGETHWDVIVYSWNTRSITLIPSLIRAKLNGIPTILWGHGYSKSPGLLRNKIRDSLTKLAIATLFYDPLAMQRCKKGKSRDDFFTAPNAIDQSKIRAAKETWQADQTRLDNFKEDNGLTDRPLILFVSRLQAKNRVDVLLAAIAHVKTDHPDIFLAVAGGGPETLKKELHQQVKNLGIEENVRFTGPLYGEDQLAPWFLSATAFCYPSNVGLSMMHAFGYGLPAIIGDDFSKCNPEIYAFKPDYNGLTFKDEDPVDLAKKISLLISQPETQQALGKNAHQTIVDTANIENMVSGFCNAIDYAVKAKR